MTERCSDKLVPRWKVVIEIKRLDAANLKEVICYIDAKIDEYDPEYAIGSLLWLLFISSFTKLKLWRYVGLAEPASDRRF